MINDAGKHGVKDDAAKLQRVVAMKVGRSECAARTSEGRMKALAEQIAELDGVEIYGRVVGVRGLMVEVAGPIHAMSVGARVIDRDRRRRGIIPCEVVGFSGAQRAADAVRAARRRAARLPRGRHVGAGGGAAVGRLARPRRQRDGRADRRQGAAAARAVALSVPQRRRRRRMRAAASARRSISACARSTPSSPAAAASAWASSPAPASASRCCCRCWRATSPPTSRSSGWSASAAARCRSSCRTISARRASRARSSWSRPPTSRR